MRSRSTFSLILSATVACSSQAMPERSPAVPPTPAVAPAPPATPAPAEAAPPAAPDESTIAKAPPPAPLPPAPGASPAPAPATAAAPAAPAGKASVPLAVALATSGRTGRVTATLTITARSDVPRVVARFRVPAGVKVAGGQAEADLGPMSKDQLAELRIELDVPARGSFRLAAGADAIMSAGVHLNASAVAELGAARAPAPAEGRPGGKGVRLHKGGKRTTP